MRTITTLIVMLMTAPAFAAADKFEAQVIEPRSSAHEINELGLVHDVGVHIGPSMGTVSSTSLNPGPVTNSQTRLMFGASTTIGLASIFYLQPEVNFVQRGYEEPFTSASGDKTVTSINHDYLELPLLAKIRTEGMGKIRPFALAGPNIGVLLSSSVNTTRTTAAGSASVVSDQRRADAFSPFSLGAVFGAGIEYEIGKSTSFTANLRYSMALTNSESAPLAADTPTRTVKNSAVQLLAGVQFAL